MKDNPRKCSVEGCETQAKHNCFDGKPYCGKHLHHMYRHGEIRTIHRRSPNNYTTNGNITTVDLYGNRGELKGQAIIDTEDKEIVSKHKWGCTPDGYVKSSAQRLLLHRLVMNCTDKYLQVDHINGNPLDNRKANLRLVTNQQNQFNSKNTGSGNNSRKGVSFRKDRNKWRAYIMLNGKQIALGSFDTEAEAIKARIQAEEKYYQEYRREEYYE